MLGICLGMQMLSTTGNEFGKINGLNLIQGKVIKFTKEENPLSTNGCRMDENSSKYTT